MYAWLTSVSGIIRLGSKVSALCKYDNSCLENYYLTFRVSRFCIFHILPMLSFLSFYFHDLFLQNKILGQTLAPRRVKVSGQRRVIYMKRNFDTHAYHQIFLGSQIEEFTITWTWAQIKEKRNA
jgi:hypothetical protein